MKHIIKLTILMLALLLPATASAYDFTVNGIYYDITSSTNRTVEVTYQSYSNGTYTSDYSGDVIIPNTVTYSGTNYSVTSIGGSAFRGCTGMTSISIPSSITSSNGAAFYGCTGLTSVHINNLEAWCKIEFSPLNDYCNPLTYAHHLFLNGVEVKDLVIPNTITAISTFAFINCDGLTSVTIPNTVTSIGDYSFYDCDGLTSFFLGSSVSSIGRYAFSSCSNLKNIIWNAVNCTSIGEDAFSYYSINNLQFGNGVEHIPAGMPSLSMSGKKLVLPNSVKTIEEGVFTGTCGAVVIGNSIENIATGAFPSGISVAYAPTTTPQPCEANAFANPQTLYVPAGSRMSYFTSQGWGEFANIIESTYVRATSVTLNKYSTTMSKGSTQQLTAGIWPSSATAQSVTWFSTNPAVATVSSSGQITAVAAGETDIMAMVDNVRATCHVTVTPLLVQSLTLSDTQLTMEPDGMYTLTATISPTNADNQTLEWIIPDNDVIVTQVVNNTRLNIGAVGTGSVTVTARTTDGSNLSASCTVTVQVNASSIALNMSSAEMTEGGVLQLVATVLPTNATNKTVTWESSNTSVATVNSNGLVTAHLPGTATITATTTDGTNLSATCSLLVKQNIIYATSVSLNKSSATLTEGNTLQLTATVLPTNATDRTVTWKSSNTSVATVNSNGLVTAIIPGTATITATTNDGTNLSATCAVTVKQNVILATSISLNKSSATLTEGENLQLTATVLPNNATDRTVTWKSSNTSVASVNTNGLVTANSPGVVTITATTNDGTNLSATCSLIVKQATVLATSITLDKTNVELPKDETLQLTATVLPSNTTNKTVNWTTSNSTVATVTSNGLVTAVAPGIATITATTTDGTNLHASCKVTVVGDLSDYDNYLSMRDTTAFHGETIVIPVAMTNADQIVSFQTDIFLPEGLEIVQEDGEYLIDPSDRMTRTHSLLSDDVSSGAVRVLCYSSNYKPFTGNSGDDLFYITVKVADDADGDYTIQLRNTLFTTSDFNEIVAPDVAGNVNVFAYILGDANNNGTVTVTDVVVTSQYVLEMNPNPFVFAAADVNVDGNITVTDVSRIAWMVLNPTLNVPLRAPALWNNGDCISAEGITLNEGETRTVSIVLDNEMAYSAFQLDLMLPEGLTPSNFRLTDRAGSHSFDVNTLVNGGIRTLCYSPSLTAINGHEGALLTFDVMATGDVMGNIRVDGIEFVTTDCQTVLLDGFAIAVNNASSVNEFVKGKTIASIDYYNLAGQRIERPESGVSLIVTTYTDGSRTTIKVIK